jgi:hypothetical protein
MNKYFLFGISPLFLTFVLDYCAFDAKKVVACNHYLTEDQPNKKDSTLIKSLRQCAYKKWQLDEIKIIGDTLMFVSPDDFFYYPFGKYSNVKTFAIGNQIWGTPRIKIYTEPNKTKVYIFAHRNSSLLVLRNPDTGLIELFNSRIFDKDIRFVRPINVGMGQLNFLQIFFKDINQSSIRGIKVVKVESTIEGIWNRYFFTNGRLEHVTFDTDYVIK